MSAWLALALLIVTPGADGPGSQTPPVIGRPADFSGAVGGPFEVEQTAEPTSLTVEGPLTLTIRITGPGNLRDLPRPPLAKLDAYRQFAVDNLDDRFVESNPPRREFCYRLRPRTADVQQVPRLKFVYFNPRIIPPARCFQTTYADPVALTVKPRTPPAEVPAEVPEWMLDQVSWDEVFWSDPTAFERWLRRAFDWSGIPFEPGSWRRTVYRPLAVAAALLPPLVCYVWFMFWRRANPDEALRANIYRSRAGATALRLLRSATDDPARRVADALTGYLHARAGLPSTATTSADVADFLRRNECPRLLARPLVDLLRRCDRDRFAPGPSHGPALADEAERLILEWEAATWAPLGS
jgi:hypothetical protein